MKSSVIVIVLLSAFSSPLFFCIVQFFIQFQAKAFVIRSKSHCVGSARLRSRRLYSWAVVVSSSSSNENYYYYPPEVLQQIKDHVSIIGVIRDSGIRGLSVRDNNRRATALCPFHDDTNPSFAIVNDNQMKMYKCFACGATGDIFTYVLQSDNNSNKITNFGQAVKYILQNYCEPQFVQQLHLDSGSSRTRTIHSYNSSSIISPSISNSQRLPPLDLTQQHLRQRIQLANAAAAVFYYQNLYKLPSAGIARQHLLELRGFTPQFIRRFCLGYAPAATSINKKVRTNPLVHHLSSLGFTPQEILQAGLAKLISDKMHSDTTTVPTSTNTDDKSHATTTTTIHNVTQSDLKDRFINRLMIPIWDTDGNQVIGFGGRLLPNNFAKNDDDISMESTYNYNPPKYLNTQGTLIFQKRQTLFGIHVASRALNSTSSRLNGFNQTHNWTISSPPPCVIIVEGYMDALALYNVGIMNVAATMGTSISQEQLHLAISVVSNYSVPNDIGDETSPSTTTATGNIILLMDQDEAGISAVERLCGTSQILFQLTTTKSNTNTSNSGINIMVASLPKGFKDPDEFIQHKRTSLSNVDNTTLESINNINQHIKDERSTIQQIFQQEIVQKAQDWKYWYLNLLLSKHISLVNDTAIASTVTHNLLHEQVSDFISTFPNSHMQSYLAKQFVDQCSERLNGTSEIWDDNSTHHVDGATTSIKMRTVADYKVKLHTEIWSMIQKKVEKKERMVNSTILIQPVSSFKLRDFPRFNKSNNERRLSLIQASILHPCE